MFVILEDNDSLSGHKTGLQLFKRLTPGDSIFRYRTELPVSKFPEYASPDVLVYTSSPECDPSQGFSFVRATALNIVFLTLLQVDE